MIKPKIKARKWTGKNHGLCASCGFLEDCFFPRSDKHTPWIAIECNEYIMDLQMVDSPDIILLEDNVIYVR